MNNFSHVPPGFRFHPTDEELVDYYLRRKIASKRIDFNVIKDVDLYKIEPWDLLEICKIGTEEQSDWYFFSHKDKKYPTGTRTNRATRAGFWKATGRDKAIYMKNNSLIGMRKTLVFYQGRAPNGQKSDWIMHEYRLETNENGTSQEEGWAVCRVFKKRIATTNNNNNNREHDQGLFMYGDHQVSFMPNIHSTIIRPHYNSCKQELHIPQYNNIPCSHEPFLQLPQLESPRVQQSSNNTASCSSMVQYGMQQQQQQHVNSLYDHQRQVVVDDHVTDWRVLDKFVASQLSQENAILTETPVAASAYSNGPLILLQVADQDHLNNQLMNNDNSETQEMTSSSQIDDMWK